MARLNHLRKVNNTLRQQLSRFIKKRKIEQETFKILQNEHQLQNVKLSAVDGALEELLLNESRNKGKKSSRRYSSRIRSFAFTLHYYSPKAYTYLRTVLSLPPPRTIRKWLEHVNCEPGFLVDVLDSIKKTPGPKMFSLVVDGMSIRKRVTIDKATNRMVGYVDIGHQHDGPVKEAKEALVFLLVPVAGRTRYPAAYFFINSIDATLQSALIRQFLQLTAEKSITVINITCDGCRANLTTLKMLGAVVPERPWFPHPSKDHKVCGASILGNLLEI